MEQARRCGTASGKRQGTRKRIPRVCPCSTIDSKSYSIYRNPMQIRVESRHLGAVLGLVPEVFQDGRGFFMETFRDDQFDAIGLPTHFVQDNHSRSTKGVVRGLHFQWD